MKISYSIISLLFIMLCTGISCKKENTKTQTFPKTLNLNSIIPLAPKVFTKTGEITDPIIINKAIISTGLVQSNKVSNPKGSITFLSDKTLQSGGDYYSVNQTGNLFLFKSSFPISPTTGSLLIFFDPFYKYSQLVEDRPGSYVYTPMLTGYGSYSTVSMNYSLLCILKKDDITYASKGKYLDIRNNEFNVDGIKTLGVKDTLVVYQYNYNYGN